MAADLVRMALLRLDKCDYPPHTHITPGTNQIIATILEHGGVPFGAFIREVLILNRPYTRLDVWVKTRSQFYVIVRDILQTAIYTLHQPYPSNPIAPYCLMYINAKGEMYPIDQKMLVIKPIFPDAGPPLLLNFIVNPFCPVADFDVNQVGYDAKGIVALGRTDIKTLTQRIRERRFTMLNGYETDIGSDPHRIANLVDLVKCYKFTPTPDTVARLPFRICSLLGLPYDTTQPIFARPCEHIPGATILEHRRTSVVKECIKCRCRVVERSK